MDSPRFNIAEYKQFVKCGLSYRISTDKIKEAKETMRLRCAFHDFVQTYESFVTAAEVKRYVREHDRLFANSKVTYVHKNFFKMSCVVNVWRGFCKGTSKVVCTNSKLTNVHIFFKCLVLQMFRKRFFLCCCVKMARRFEDDALVMVFEANMDEWLKEVQFRSGQKILLVIFVARGMTINLEGCGDWFLIGFLIGDMVKYVYVANVLRDGIVLRCILVCSMKMFFQKIVGWVWLLREGIVVIC